VLRSASERVNSSAKDGFAILAKPKIRVLSSAGVLSQMAVIVVLLKRVAEFIIKITLALRKQQRANRDPPQDQFIPDPEVSPFICNLILREQGAASSLRFPSQALQPQRDGKSVPSPHLLPHLQTGLTPNKSQAFATKIRTGAFPSPSRRHPRFPSIGRFKLPQCLRVPWQDKNTPVRDKGGDI
jgi:hypothetical protein